MFNLKREHLARAHFDWILLFASYALAFYGVLAITIANYNPSLGAERSMQELIMAANNGRLQLLWVVVSMVVVALIQTVSYEFIGRMWPIIYLVDIFLLALVLGTSKINGVSGWFRFLDRTFQPSELAKIALIITLSKRLTKYPDNPFPNKRHYVHVIAHFALPAILIIAQPDVGTFMVFVVIFAVLIFMCGTSLKVIFGWASLAIGFLIPVVFYLASTNNFRWLRLVAFINPESDPTGSSYQIINSKVTIGSGGLYGKGAWAEGTLTHLNYVPENHTDFIFTVVGETLGFVGSAVLLILYLIVIIRMLLLAYNTDDRFGRLVILGVMAMLLFHVFENVGMCIGVMPITGIPLPFISYGGTNLVVNMAGIALVLNVTNHKKTLDLRSSRNNE